MGVPPTPDEPTACAVLTPLLRAHRRRLVARLARSLGIDRWGAAEDAVQAATLQAWRHWPTEGVPENPVGWLYRVAVRLAIDQWRASGKHEARGKDADSLASSLAQTWLDDVTTADWTGQEEAVADQVAGSDPAGRFAGELSDDELAVLFAACHPALPAATQVALAVRAATDIDLDTLAAALLTTPSALAQRLARARHSLQGVAIDVPAGADLRLRFESVATAIVSMFQMGWQAGATDPRALSWEAIRLARALASHAVTASAESDALSALLLLHGARLSGRVDQHGDIVPLPGQARDRWDAGLVRMGLAHLQRSQRASRLSRWHLLAGIAAEHAVAPSYEATAWPRIVAAYDLLLGIDPSPAPRLAHAIACIEAGMAERGLALVDGLMPRAPLALTAHAHAARAQALHRLGRRGESEAALQLAIAACTAPADQRWLGQRLLDWRRAPTPAGPAPEGAASAA